MKKTIFFLTFLLMTVAGFSQSWGIKIDTAAYFYCSDVTKPVTTGLVSNCIVVTTNARLYQDSVYVDITSYPDSIRWRANAFSFRLCDVDERFTFYYDGSNLTTMLQNSTKQFLHEQTGISLAKFKIINK